MPSNKKLSSLLMSNVNDNFLTLLLGVGILDDYTKVLLI